jgi:hypothetical protein
MQELMNAVTGHIQEVHSFLLSAAKSSLAHSSLRIVDFQTRLFKSRSIHAKVWEQSTKGCHSNRIEGHICGAFEESVLKIPDIQDTELLVRAAKNGSK